MPYFSIRQRSVWRGILRKQERNILAWLAERRHPSQRGVVVNDKNFLLHFGFPLFIGNLTVTVVPCPNFSFHGGQDDRHVVEPLEDVVEKGEVQRGQVVQQADADNAQKSMNGRARIFITPVELFAFVYKKCLP